MFKKLRDCSIQVNHNSIEHGNYVKPCFLRLSLTTLLDKMFTTREESNRKNYIRSTYQSRYVLLYDVSIRHAPQVNSCCHYSGNKLFRSVREFLC